MYVIHVFAVIVSNVHWVCKDLVKLMRRLTLVSSHLANMLVAICC